MLADIQYQNRIKNRPGSVDSREHRTRSVDGKHKIEGRNDHQGGAEYDHNTFDGPVWQVPGEFDDWSDAGQPKAARKSCPNHDAYC